MVENMNKMVQKYRMFLKKVAERGLWTSHGMSERILRSSFATGYNPSLIHSPISISNSTFPFSRNSPPLLRPAQSSLLAASFNFHRPLFNGSNPFSLHNNTMSPLHSNNAAPPTPLSSMYHHQNQTQSLGSSFQNFANPSPFLQSGNYASFPPLNHNTTNYGELRTGQMLPIKNVNDLSTGLPNLGYSATNWSNRTAKDNGFLGNVVSGYVPNTAAGFSYSAPTTLGGRGSSFGTSTAVNQISMPFTVGNQERNNPLMSQQNANVGLGNDFGFNLFNDVSNNPGTSCNNPPALLEDCDLDLVFGSLNSTTPFQQQDVEGAVNIDCSYQPEINTNDFLNVEFSNSCTLVDNSPSNEQGSHEIQSASAEETANADFGTNGNSMDSYFPNFDVAQTQSSPDEPMDSDLIDIVKAIGTSDENQGWGEDFLDILLGNNPY